MAAKKKHTLRETSAEMCRIADTYKDGFEKMSKKCRNASEKVKTPELRRRLEKLSSKYLDAAQTVRENKAHYLETVELSLITGNKEFVTQSVKDDGLSMIKSFSNLDSKLFKEYHDIENSFIEREEKGDHKMTMKKKGTVTPRSFKFVFVRNGYDVLTELEKYGSRVREVRTIGTPHEHFGDNKCKITLYKPKSGNYSVWFSRVTINELNSLLDSESFNKVWGYVQSGSSRRNSKITLNEYAISLSESGYMFWGVIVIDEKKTTPKKKTPKKPSQVMTVRKLVSEGKIPAGHVRRLGIRKQTPPPPKSRKADEKRKALLAGYRVSKNGNLYYETRENRSDKPREKPRRGRRVPVKTTPKKRK